MLRTLDLSDNDIYSLEDVLEALKSLQTLSGLQLEGNPCVVRKHCFPCFHGEHAPEFVQIEAIISSVIDEYPSLMKRKQLVAFVSCFIMFLGSLLFVTNGGMYLVIWIWCNFLIGMPSISVILICLVEVFIFGWTYGTEKFVRDLEFMTQEKVHWWWPLCWKFVTPIILTFIFICSIVFNTTITYYGFLYPSWSIALGWCSCATSMICIPLYMGYKLLYYEEGDLIERLQASLCPEKERGPVSDFHRKEWINMVNYEKAQSG